MVVRTRSKWQRYAQICALICIGLSLTCRAKAWGPGQTSQSTPQSAPARAVGTIQSIAGKTITLHTDAGAEAIVVVQDDTKILRIAPGQKDLKDATPIQLQDLQPGDRILVRGKMADDAKSLLAISIIAMKKIDIAESQARDREDWQKRGVGGLVTAIDPVSGTVTISITPFYSIAVKTSPKTVFLRYALDSVKFSDAKRGTFDQIKTGDQLRARGDRSEDGKVLTAEEVVSGTFRNIAGTVIAVDATNNTLNVMDLITKKPVLVKVTLDTALRKLTPEIAQRIAVLLKGGSEGAAAPASSAAPGSRPGGAADLQRMLSRLPAITLADLQKGDALMIVSTQSEAASPVNAITLLAGVEPVLTASSNSANAASLLSGWSLSSAPGGDSPTP